jgi:hypothetical protein
MTATRFVGVVRRKVHSETSCFRLIIEALSVVARGTLACKR